MAHSLLISVLILFGCINHSHPFSVQSNDLQRERRDSSPIDRTQQVAETIFDNQQELEQQIQQSTEENKKEMAKICSTLAKATDAMAALSTQDVACAGQWGQVQDGLRDGLLLVIKAYRKYIKLHRQICQSIENFAQQMINSYQDELNALDRMSPPGDTSDINSDNWRQFADRIPSGISYAAIHYKTLPIAADCIGDLTMHTWKLQQLITRTPPASQTRVIYVMHPAGPQRIDVPCGETNIDNGYQACGCALSARTRDYAKLLCRGCIKNLNSD